MKADTKRTEAHEWYKPFLQEGETVRWAGKPGVCPFWTTENAPVILLAPLCSLFLSAIGAALFFMLTHGLQRQPAAMAGAIALALPLAVCLIHIGFVQWITPRLLLRRTAYVITDKRILRRRGRRIDALDTLHLPEVTLRPEKDGHGSLLFGRHPMETVVGYGRNSQEFAGIRREPFALWHVPQARQVLALLPSPDSKGGAA